MKTTLGIGLAALVALTTACAAIDDRSGETDQRFTNAQYDVRYKLYLPEGYETDAERTWPLLLFLHGAGERGDDLERVTIHGPIGIAREKPMPFVIVSPLCPAGRAWRNAELLALLDDVLQRYRVDPTRVLLTGLSMGGYGTWNLGLAHPERFAAIAPICGGGETLTMRMHGEEGRAAVRSLAIWAFHGADDKVVAPDESKRMIRMLEKVGARPKLTIYDGVGHGAWKPAYADPNLWSWLLEQRR